MNNHPLQVGDRLAFRAGYNQQWFIHTITRILPSGRYCCGPHTVNPDLTVRGPHEAYGPRRAHHVTEQIEQHVARVELLARIARFRMQNLPTKTLEQIVAIIGEYEDA